LKILGEIPTSRFQTGKSM